MTTWLVTGCNRGLGLGFAQQLQRRGDTVIATCRNPSAAPELQQLSVQVEALNVADSESVRALAERLRGTPIDVLVNNSGIGGHGTNLDQMDADSLRPFFEVNTLGPLRVTAALLPNLREGQDRKIAHITSRMGSIADNEGGGAYAYRASKTALNSIHKSMALELGPQGFTCVTLHPGWVRTDMGGDGGRIGVDESVSAMLSLIDTLTKAHNGEFLDAELGGEVIPW